MHTHSSNCKWMRWSLNSQTGAPTIRPLYNVGSSANLDILYNGQQQILTVTYCAICIVVPLQNVAWYWLLDLCAILCACVSWWVRLPPCEPATKRQQKHKFCIAKREGTARVWPKRWQSFWLATTAAAASFRTTTLVPASNVAVVAVIVVTFLFRQLHNHLTECWCWCWEGNKSWVCTFSSRKQRENRTKTFNTERSKE